MGYAESEKGCREASPKQCEVKYSWKWSTSETSPRWSEYLLKQHGEKGYWKWSSSETWLKQLSRSITESDITSKMSTRLSGTSLNVHWQVLKSTWHNEVSVTVSWWFLFLSQWVVFGRGIGAASLKLPQFRHLIDHLWHWLYVPNSHHISEFCTDTATHNWENIYQCKWSGCLLPFQQSFDLKVYLHVLLCKWRKVSYHDHLGIMGKNYQTQYSKLQEQSLIKIVWLPAINSAQFFTHNEWLNYLWACPIQQIIRHSIFHSSNLLERVCTQDLMTKLHCGGSGGRVLLKVFSCRFTRISASGAVSS